MNPRMKINSLQQKMKERLI
ncbi:Protein of unknown function [Bacillus wiedmannii]|nr:Protein of unknown function [Bacillus wiedmannii]